MVLVVTFASVCSGIEAASVAFEPLGWHCLWLAEIDKAASSVLAYRYPHVDNHGDLLNLPARVASGEIPPPDVLIGGTPCQSFSVAGLRGGMTDSRGALTLVFVLLVDAIDARRALLGWPPVIVVWENVPGVLNHKDNPFGCFLGALAGEDRPLVPAGKRWTNAGLVFGPERAVGWRTLDAQYFGLAQRRRRVFVVASAGARFDPAAILFECEGVRRDIAPSRETGENIAGSLDASADRSRGAGNNPGQLTPYVDELSPTAGSGSTNPASHGKTNGTDRAALVVEAVPQWWDGRDVAQTLDAVLAKGQTMPEKDRFPAVLHPVDAVCPTLRAGANSTGGDRPPGTDVDTADSLIALAYGGNNTCGPIDVATARNEHSGPHGRLDFESETFIVEPHCFDARQQDVLQYGAISGPVDTDGYSLGVAFAQNTRNEVRLIAGDGSITGALSAQPGMKQTTYIAFSSKDHGGDAAYELAPTPGASGHVDSHSNAGAPPAVTYAIQERAICENPDAGPDANSVRADGCAYTLEARAVPQAVCVTGSVTHCLRAEGFDASEDGTGRGQPITAYSIMPMNSGRDFVARPTDIAQPLVAAGPGGGNQGGDYVTTRLMVRRLLPVECERLQGFPDGWTERGVTKPQADGPRYKQLGNSMAVPVIHWLGARIEAAFL